MKQKIQAENFEKHTSILGNRETYLVFAGMPEFVNKISWRIPTSTPHKEIRWVKRENLQDTISDYQSREWTAWIALNEIDRNHMTVDHVRSVAVLFFDIDAPRKNRALPATVEEKMIAKLQTEKLVRYLSDKYNARCFTACSGNGYHIYCPIPVVKLPNPEDSWTFNNQLRSWMRQQRESSGVEFDHTYNINRLAQPIGFHNKKIPGFPLPTFWLGNFTIADVETARENNRSILEAIQSIESEVVNITAQVKSHPSLNQLLRNDPWLRDMCDGYWVKYGYLSRSEAELAVVRELVHWGFSDGEIYRIMSQCGIGKWPTAGESYRRNTIRKARLWEARKRR